MIYFRNDDDEYVSWVERHPDAFVLNVSTGGKQKAMLHTSRCSHLYPTSPARSHTRTYPKACSHNQGELELWGAEAGLAVAVCPDCGL